MAIAATRERRDFAPVKEEYIEKIYDRHLEAGGRSDDVSLIRTFITEKRARRPVTLGYVRQVVQVLTTVASVLPVPFRTAAVGDVYCALSALDMAKNPDGSRRFGQSSAHIQRVHLKAFLRWMRRRKINAGIDPDDVAEIAVPPQNPMPFQVEDLLTADELKAMLRACRTPRDAAVVALIYEGALRPIEVAALRWRDVTITDEGIKLNVVRKTDRPRAPLCPLARPYLLAWATACPYPPTGDNLVFCSFRTTTDPKTGEPIYYPLRSNSIGRQLQQVAKRAGVERYQHMYQFRHTRTTDLLNARIPEAQVMQITHGGRTTMFKYYCHVTNSDADESIRQLYGLATASAPGGKMLQPSQCPRCLEIAGVTDRYCPKCGLGLSVEVEQERETARAQIWADPEFRSAVEDAVRRMQAKDA